MKNAFRNFAAPVALLATSFAAATPAEARDRTGERIIEGLIIGSIIADTIDRDGRYDRPYYGGGGNIPSYARAPRCRNAPAYDYSGRPIGTREICDGPPSRGKTQGCTSGNTYYEVPEGMPCSREDMYRGRGRGGYILGY